MLGRNEIIVSKTKGPARSFFNVYMYYVASVALIPYNATANASVPVSLYNVFLFGYSPFIVISSFIFFSTYHCKYFVVGRLFSLNISRLVLHQSGLNIPVFLLLLLLEPGIPGIVYCYHPTDYLLPPDN